MFASVMAAAVSTLSFNLDCTGTRVMDTWEGLKRTPISSTEVQAKLRVDLVAKLWCSGECTETSPLAKVTDGFIVFQKASSDDNTSYMMVNRRTGKFTDFEKTNLSKSLMVTSTEGTCQLRLFGGFPLRKF